MGVIIVYLIILYLFVHSIQLDIIWFNNLHTYINVDFGKYIFMDTDVETNQNNYSSYKIHFCTICPTFGIISGKVCLFIYSSDNNVGDEDFIIDG